MRVIVLVGCLLAVQPLARSALADDRPMISTSATAHGRLPNTVADVSLAVQAQAADVASVQKVLTAGSAQLLTYLQGQSVERLQTTGISVTPDVEEGKRGTTRITGYSGRVAVTFRVPADRLGAVVAGGLEHGGNVIDSTSLQPTEMAVEAMRRELETQAVRKALLDVRAVAEAAGRKLGSVGEIVIGADGGMPTSAPARCRCGRP